MLGTDGQKNSKEDLFTCPSGQITIEFSRDELWVLQAFVRHEMERMGEWKFPPVSRELNEQIAMAILLCEDSSHDKQYRDNREPRSAPLRLSYGDCLLIDHRVPSNLKDANGTELGKNILLKTFVARRDLSTGWISADDPTTTLTPKQIQERMDQFEHQYRDPKE